MSLTDLITELLSNPRVQLPEGLKTSLVELAKTGVGQTGSSLRTHLSAGCVGLTIPNMYLDGVFEEDIDEYVLSTESKSSIRTVWYSTCRVIATLCVQAVSAAPYRRLPQRVRDKTVMSGESDVLTLPTYLLEQAVGLLDITHDNGTVARGECSSDLVRCVGGLYGIEGYDENTNSKFRRFFNEMIGSSALYLLDVCPEDHDVSRFISQNVSKRLCDSVKSMSAL